MKKSPVYRAVLVGAVLMVIAMLSSIMIPMPLSRPGGEKAQAKSEVKAIENALRVYQSDYNKFPEYGSYRLQSTGTGQTDAALTDILRGLNTNANPRGFVYLDANEMSLGWRATITLPH